MAQPGGLMLGWMNRVSSIKDGRVELSTELSVKCRQKLTWGSASVVGRPHS